ncbi:HlyD family efflux transporter periplasmic adaptor subunit [Actinoplanes sp. NPDC051470]|uniref:HlyD family efflux transporter periplasmic adaptor subunit n=1 Tax=unclassified Actinoplanes TaxID=2626549 RepID=UPI00344478F3
MNATITPAPDTEATEAPAEQPKQPRHRLRRALLVTRTVLVVSILLTAAVLGGNHIVRQRLAERTMVDAGTAVLTAQPITVGSADAAVVSRVLTTERASVTAGAVLATATLTADGGGEPRVQQLRAPAAGIVTEINIAPGQVARAGEPIVTLYDPADLAFQVDVPLETLRKLRLGMTAYVTGPGLSGRIPTTLKQVEPKVDSTATPATADLLTVVLQPDPASLATVRTLVPGLQFDVVVDTKTAVGRTPAVNSA